MEKGKQDLLKGSGDISKKLIQITKTSDLLRTIPILAQMLEFGRNEVNIEISKSVNKCLRGLNIEINNHALQILVEDLTDKYKYDSIEDIQQCLKNGRRGDYGKTYGNLNMIIISKWMEIHLDRKAAARESEMKKQKHDFKDREEYESAVKVGIKNQKEDADRHKKAKDDNVRNEVGYQEWKVNYEANKKK